MDDRPSVVIIELEVCVLCTFFITCSVMLLFYASVCLSVCLFRLVI